MSAASPATRLEPALLRDGAAIDVRRGSGEDLDAVVALHERLSDRSRLMRFFSLGVDVPASVRALVAAPDITNLLATAGRDVIAHACLVPTDLETAEVAFVVDDAWHARGIATVLLERLAAEGTQQGLTTLTAEVRADNSAMLDVFREAGLPFTVRTEAGIVDVALAIGPGATETDAFERRHRAAASAGLRHVLAPAAVAVIGASARRGSVGGELLRNLRAGRYRGALHAVHPSAASVADVPAVPTVADLPPGIELGIIAVPARDVLPAARACIAAGFRALVVISAGFGETGAAGRRCQARLLELCRRGGVRLVGPNCLGVVNTDPAVSLNATFAPQRAPAGGVALASQSGAIGIVAMDAAARRGIGLSSFVSLGNRADVSSNDLLRYWADDPRTRVIALYLESFGNPRAFAQVARRVARVKPIVAVKAGRSRAGVRAAASHTGALVEGSDALADTLLAEAGVIRVDTVGDLLDVATVLDRAGLPRGDAIAIVTNAGGAGIACADAAEAAGLQLPRLQAVTRARVRATRPGASLGNPVDLIADAPGSAYPPVLDALAADPAVDAIVALHVPPLAGRSDDAIANIVQTAPRLGKPVVVVPLAQRVPRPVARRAALLDTPEGAATALARIARHVRWRERPVDVAERPEGIDRLTAAAVLAGAGGGWLGPDAARQLADAYRLPLARQEVTTTASGVRSATRALGAPVAVKAVAPGLAHKTEHGAVALGLASPAAAARAAGALARRLTADGIAVTGFLVQEMVADGVELLVGATSDPTFGPVVACGAGGITAELWRDVQVRLAPVSRRTATDMMQSLHCAPLLHGWRGAPRCDAAAVADVICRIAALAFDHPEVAEIEVNPLLARPDGAVAVDLRVRVRDSSTVGRLRSRPHR